MKERPQFLNLTQIHLPITGWVSILHRISGLVIFLALPFLFCAFEASLTSSRAFSDMKLWLANPLVTFLAWATLSALFYHLIAGVRHILMDLGIGVSLLGGRITAALSLLTSFAGIGYLAYWFWG